jgi:hypothetical protein
LKKEGVDVKMVTYKFWYMCRMSEVAKVIERIMGATWLGLYA